ncbi:MAG: pentapeptide repeat-containing protein [Candidatus Hodarchaeota archaeon]
MPNEEHLQIIRQGVDVWNKWREEHPSVERPDLTNADLMGAYLRGAYILGANLSMADLRGANLSGAIIDEFTHYQKISGCEPGVNGFWCKDTDSAALMMLTPPGNSMQGSNPEAVVESLKRARRLHGYSMTLVGIVLLIAVLKPPEITLPYFKLPVDPVRFGLLAMPMSIGILSLVTLFLADALKGARYLNDRQAAMTVGNFPWVLSKFAGSGCINQIQSLIARLVMSFHPLVYLYYSGKWEVINIGVFGILLALLLIFSGWTFVLSQRFQRPILFDRRTEEERQDNLTKLTKAVEAQTATITELIDILKPKQKAQRRKKKPPQD